MKLVYLSLGWVAGVYLGSQFAPSWVAVLGISAAALLLALLLRRNRALVLAALCLIAFLCGMLRFQSTVVAVDEGVLQYYNGRGSVEIKGIVDSDPEPGEQSTSFRLSAREINIEGQWSEVSGAALVYAPNFPNSQSFHESRDFPYYRYGDLLEIEGNLEEPPELGDFDYQEYLARQGIHSVVTIYDPQDIELISGGQGFEPLERLYGLRNDMSQALASALHEPQGSLAQGILLGLRSSIPDDVLDSFSETGTMHIIAISGLHIAIVAGILVSVGAWLFGRQRSIYILMALGAIWGYTLLSGMYPSTLRAAIMGSLFLWAVWLGRPRSAITALAVAAAVMVGLQPLILWDVAFQLSFAAMAGLILLAPKFQTLGRRVFVGEERVGWAASTADVVIASFAVTLGAILATLPIVAFYFHRVSLVGLPATLLALPALPGIIITSGLVGGIGLFVPWLAQIVGWVAWLFLTYMIEVVEFFSAVPFSSFEIGRIDAYFVWFYYGAILGALWLGTNKKWLGRLTEGLATAGRLAWKLPAKWVVLPLGVAAILVWIAALTVPGRDLEVYFLDVGQGDAIFIRTPSHHDILVDGGPSAELIAAQLGEKLPFWDRTLELVVLTHPHEDHLAGLVEVLRRYEVEQVLEPPRPEETTPAYDEWRRLIEQEGIESTVAEAGQLIELGRGTTLEVLHPQSTLLEGTASDIDNNGIALRLVCGEVSFLLTADIQEEGEHELLSQGVELASTVLKVAHHGSGYSTSPEFLAAVDPQVAVISVGEDNPFGHPSQEVEERLDEVRLYRTDERGTIELITDGERLWVKTER